MDQDPDSSARISLYYNETNLIVSDLSEEADGEGDSFVWNLDALPAGDYQLSAVIRDETSEVHVEACCNIRKSEREVAARVAPLTDPVTDETGVTVAKFEVVLDDSPRAGSTVLMNLSLSDTGEAEILDGLTYLEFTAQNWSEPQVVRVRGKDDCEVDGDKPYHLQFSPAVSSDPTFGGTVTPAVALTNRDNEVAGETLSICGFQLQSQQVVGDSTHYEYTARLNNEGLGIGGATASATSLDNLLTLISGMPLSFPAVAENQNAWSLGSFTVSAPAGQEPNLGALTWGVDARRPTIESVAPADAMEGEAYSYRVQVSGGPGDVFTFSLLDAPDGMTIDPVTGLIQWTPDVGQQGSQTVLVEVRDQLGGITRQTFTIEVAPDGSTARVMSVDTNPGAEADYQSLADAIGALPSTFEWPIVIRAKATSGQADTNAVDIAGFTPTAEKPLIVVLEDSYTLAIDAAESRPEGIIIQAPHVTLRGEGGRIVFRNNGFDNAKGIVIGQQPEHSLVIVDGVRLEGISTGEPTSNIGIVASDSNAAQVLRNNVVTGFTGGNASAGLFVGGKAYVYNNTLVDNAVGLRVETLGAMVYNNLAVGNNQDYSGVEGAWTNTGHNLSSDGSSPDESYNNRDVAFVDAENRNYALAPWDEAASGQGSDLSGIGFYPFAEDIRRQVRTSPWDIGAHTVGEVSNWPPFINSAAVVTAEEEKDYQYAVEASDNDGDTLTYQLAESPSGMSINSRSGLIQWQPTSEQVGDFTVLIEVTDGRGGIAQQEFVLVVSPANSGGARLIVVDTNPQATADHHSLAAAIAAEGGELTQPLLIRARATTGLPETEPVVIEGFGTSAENPVTVILEKGYRLEVNALTDATRALLVRNGHTRIRSEGGEIVIHNNGYDSAAGILVERQPEDSVVMLDRLRIKGVITGAPASATGISATDPKAIYVLRNNLVSGFTGSYTNHGLHVTGPAFIYNNTLVGNRYGLRVESANAAVYNNLSVNNLEDFVSWQNVWSVTGHNVSSDDTSPDARYRNRAAAFVDGAGGNFALVPWDDAALGHGLDLSATEFYPFNTDAAQGIRTTPWDVGALMAAEVDNWPPFIDSEPVLEATEEEAYRYEVLATDQDGDALNYQLVQAPTGMTIQSGSGLIDWVPSSGQAGEAEVVVEVSDGAGGTARQEFTIAVAAAPEPPEEEPTFWEKFLQWLRNLFRGWFTGW